MEAFVYQGSAARVVFGVGSSQSLAAELEALKLKRILVLSTPEQRDLAEAVSTSLGSSTVGVFAGAVMHVPVAAVKEGLDVVRRVGADGLLAVGGGSTTGLAKALALEVDLPIVALPTTYAGSEMTPIYGVTENGIKRTGKSAKVLPKLVVYDPELTLGLPIAVSAASGMNAIAHAAEGLYAADRNPMTDLMAAEGIRALAKGLPGIHNNGRDLVARSDALYGAWLCGSVLGQVGMALHHKLCHTLGGSFDLPHAEVHSVILPQALHFNSVFTPEAMANIERAMGRGVPAAAAVFDLTRELGVPVSLRDLGMKEQDLDRATDLALMHPYWNPRPLTEAERPALRQLLQAAYEGLRPNTD